MIKDMASRLLLLVLTCIWTPVMAFQISFTGHAYTLDSETLVYSEQYTETYTSDREQLLSSNVEYVSQTGGRVATKRLDYRPNVYAPNFHFQNLQTGYEESLVWLQPGEVLISSTDKRGKPKQKKLKLDVDAGQTYVADAGFDQYIRDNLTQLLNGENMEFRFLNPARLTWYRFQAVMIEKTSTLVEIEVRPRATLLRWLVEPIILTYNLNPERIPLGRLLTYEGLTNISFDNENYVNARITYDYEFGKNQPVALAF